MRDSIHVVLEEGRTFPSASLPIEMLRPSTPWGFRTIERTNERAAALSASLSSSLVSQPLPPPLLFRSPSSRMVRGRPPFVGNEKKEEEKEEEEEEEEKKEEVWRVA